MLTLRSRAAAGHGTGNLCSFYARWSCTAPSAISVLLKRYSASIHLGPEFTVCKSCFAECRTGDFEWANLSPKERVEFFFSEDAVALLAACVLCAWGYFGNILSGEDEIRMVAGAGSVIMGSLLAMLWSVRLVTLFWSIRRTNRSPGLISKV